MQIYSNNTEIVTGWQDIVWSLLFLAYGYLTALDIEWKTGLEPATYSLESRHRRDYW